MEELIKKYGSVEAIQDLIEERDHFHHVLLSIRRCCENHDSGRAGCTFGDTDYDSLSVVYGINNEKDWVVESMRKLHSKFYTKRKNKIK
ncbi:hypothetical protein [Tenacibaculum ovolyticum]|uniref:hypothetical protein n=1 Tax=Tenacibaculum ovolyticum TaxID=104270 RepID=UPI0007ED9CD0|nr:hypothetical protein [Tenacibaculum ovolyticum]